MNKSSGQKIQELLKIQEALTQSNKQKINKSERRFR